MNKITVRLHGGLGNQIFCYAFGRCLALKLNTNLILDKGTGFVNDPFKRKFSLDFFPNIYSGIKFDVKLVKTNIFIKIKNKSLLFFNKKLPLKFKKIIEEPSPYKFQDEYAKTNFLFNPYFIGYWASYKYYSGYEDLLRFELKPNSPKSEIGVKYMTQIQDGNSCFLHFRTYKEDTSIDHKSLYNYYVEAIKIINSKFSNLKLFVFSDDISIAKEELIKISDNLVFINNTSDLEDFYLMYLCKHSIIADSTFSWWAAWLSDNSEKCVIAPRGLSPWGDDWLPENWIKINV
jgi:hypothetical protein